MRVGIVTQPLVGNFGGILQNYALQQVLRKLGHEPITIDYFGGTNGFRYKMFVIKRVISHLINNHRLPLGRAKYLPSGVSDIFIRKNISLTDCTTRYRSRFIQRYHLEALVAGSDQIWRPIYNNSLPDMFLKFAKQSNVRKIAYAASFGVAEKEFTQNEISECKSYALNFDAVSVREISGVNLFREYFGVDASKVLDPTLLLTSLDYSTLLGIDQEKSISLLGTYILDPLSFKSDIITHITKTLNTGRRIDFVENDTSHSPYDWIRMFAESNFVITDSFHGTVFSIIFHTPFISIINSQRGSDRFSSLLAPLGLGHRMIYDYSPDKIDSIIRTQIDWDGIDIQINKMRNESISFLRNALS